MCCFSSAFAQQSKIDSLTKIVSKTGTTLAYIDALNSLAWMLSKTDSTKAMNYAIRAKTLATNKKYINGLAEAYKSIGNVQSYKNHTSVAVENFIISNEYYTKLDNRMQIGANYNNIGMAYKIVGNLNQALVYFQKAEKIHRSGRDMEAASTILNNLGALHYDLGNYNRAIEYYMECTKLMDKIKRPKENAQTFINIGNVLRLQKNFREAFSYYDKAIKNLSLNAFEKANFKRGVQICYNNLGAIYLRQEKYKQAIPFLEKSIKIVEESKNFAGLALVQQNIGYAYTKLRDFKKAEEWFDKSYATALKYNKANMSTFAEIYNHRSSLDSAMVNFQQAFFIREMYRNIKDSLLNDKLSKQINELNTKYQSEKKQQEIILLNNKNLIQGLELNKSKLEVQNQELENDRNIFKIGSQTLLLQKNKVLLDRKQLETKAKAQQIKLLASQNDVQKLELLKRNIFLGIIAGALLITILLSYLFYNRYKLKQEARLHEEVITQQDLATKAVLNAEENERKRISGELHDGLGQLFSAVKLNLSALTDGLSFKDEHTKEMFGKTMNLVDESCKEVRVISHQMAPNVLLKSGLAAAVRDFISKIDSRRLKINLETFGLQERLDQNIETVLYRVIQETVNNVIKHAGANSLDIQLNKDEEGVNAMIEDNGKGFEASQIEKFEGIGLKNIRTRVTFLKGTVDFSSSPGQGTLIAIFIPF
jgi:two-component system NarL family sensor kinase